MKYYNLIKRLESLRFVCDSHESHPEESALHHVVQSYQMARRESDDPDFWTAALFHDIGKTIETHGHEQLSVDILVSFGYNNEKVLWLIANHMRMRWFLNGRIKKLGKIRGLLTSPWISELIHLRRVDGLGRRVGTSPSLKYEEIDNLLRSTEYESR